MYLSQIAKCICLKPKFVVQVILEVGTDTWEGKDEERWDVLGRYGEKYIYAFMPNTNTTATHK